MEFGEHGDARAAIPNGSTHRCHLSAIKVSDRIGDEFGVSRERVRQIGVCAFEKVQKSVKNRVALMESPAPLPAH